MKALPATLPPTFTTKTARSLGVHTRDLYAWRDTGQVMELSRGVFRRTDASPPTYPDMLAVAHRAPNAVVCCVSAATVHDLTDEMPTTVQIAVSTRCHSPVIKYPPVTVFRFDDAIFELGLSSFDAGSAEPIRIYDPARTVVDLMRFRRRLGEPVAHTALQRYLGTEGARPAVLLEYAHALNVFGPVRAALDVAIAR